MSSVDNRVVQMQFDNRGFESGVQTSLKSLDALKRGLNLDASAKSLANLDRAGRSFSLAGIADGVDALNRKFSAFGIMGITVLQNLTNSALNFAKNLTSSLTVDPIKTGLQEYETKINAIQTILTNTASKGTKLEDVNKALAELNTYADQTIYNFAEMTRNIGTFTAAGVDLKTSTASIKGIANLAAGSGSTALQASTAMYQLSQAIASGSVKLMDWNSVVNAGMGGELFQKALEKTAKGLGKGRNMAVSFRESLQDGWLTTEVLTKTLNQFANDPALIKAATQVKTFTQLLDTMKESVQSGWAVSWENIIGNKDEAAKTLTAINNAFGKVAGASADARNQMLKFWKDNGGRDAFIEGITNAFKGLSSIVRPISEAFKEIFPPMTGARLVEITKNLRDLTKNFKIGEETSNNIKRSFAGLFAILDIGKQAFVAIAGGLKNLIKYFLPASSGLLSFTGSIGDMLVALDKAIRTSGIFNVAVQKIGNFLKPIADGIKKSIEVIVNTFNALRNVDTSGLDTFAEKVKARFQPFTFLGDIVAKSFSKIVEGVKKVAPIFYKLASIVGDSLGKLQSNLVTALDGANFNSLFDIVNGGLFAAILLGIKKFISSLTDITNNAGGFLKSFTNILDGVRGCLQAYQSNLKAKTLLTIAIAMGILSASLMALSLIDSKKLTSSLAAMSAMFIELFGSMAVFQMVMNGSGFKGLIKVTVAMIALSTAILLLSFAMTKLAKLDWAGILKGLTAIAGLSAILVATAKLLSANSGAMIKGATGFVIFAAAINVLTNAVAKLGALDVVSLTKGLIGVGVLCTELALFMKVTDLSGMGLMKGLGILALAAAIVVLGEAVKKFGSLDPNALIRGLAGVAVVLAEVALFVNTTGNAKHVISTAIGLTILAASMLIFAQAIGQMGKMSWDQIGKGLGTMAGALLIVTLAINQMPKGMIFTGVGLIAIATALIILSKALQTMGGMSQEAIAKSLITLAGSLTIIAIAMKFMTTALPGAAALLVISAALSILALVLTSLGNMSLVEIGRSLLMLGGVFTVLGVAALVLGPVTPILLGLGAAIALIGIGTLAAGVGLLAFAAGLTALAIAGTAGAAALTLAVTAILGLIPLALKMVGQGIVAFADVIGNAGPTFVKAIVTVLTALIDAIIKVTPKVIKLLDVMLTELLKLLVKYVPKLVMAGIDIILALLKGVADNIGKIVTVATDIIVNFMAGIAKNLPRIIQSGIDLMLAFINGIANGINNNSDKMIAAGANLMNSIINACFKALKTAIGGFTTIGKQLVDGLIEGLKAKMVAVSTWTENLGKSMLDSIKKVLGIHSPSRVFRDEVGAMIAQGVADGIKIHAKEAKKASEDMGKDVYDSAKAWIDEQNYYHKISLDQELYVWEEVQKKYIAGTEKRKAVDKEVYRVKQEMVKASYDASVKWLDKEKSYNRVTLAQELAAWQRIQGRYLKGSVEREQADREVYRVKQEMVARQKELDQEYYDASKEINNKLKDDIQSVNDEYENALQSRTDSLYRSYGLFDKVGNKEEVTGTDLISNLQGQVDEFESWQKNIKELTRKGIDEGLIKELTDMGPKSLAQIQALNAMTSPELATYVSLWKTKYVEARQEASFELEGMKSDTQKKISELNSQASIDLQTYKSTWIRKTAELRSGVNLEMAQMSSDVVTTVSTMRTQAESEITKLNDNMMKTFKTPDWKSVGANIVVGILAGVKKNEKLLMDEMIAMAKAALLAAKKALGIKSPSKEFEQVGMYSVMGLVNGLTKFSNLVVTAGENIGNSAIDSLRNAISNIAEVVSGDIDLTPTIRPVVDLTDVQSGIKTMSSLFNMNQGINVSGVTNKASAINQNGSTPQTASKGQSTTGASVSFTQNNYSPTALSRLDIYRQTKNQFSALKGLVNI